MQETANMLWEESERYIGMAEQTLNPPSLRTGLFRAKFDNREWLRISFLFPTLPEKGKTDLLSVRRFFLAARASQQREKTHPRESAEQSEAMAEHAAEQLREALPSFSEAQREILEEHYIFEKSA